ncbi:hypothetical protein [Vibrio parahaemolyticus]|uniref:hypothetical protein n=1 Tax=Vibrio parahaemolyticus TaxID=670 RepID=UPI003891F4EF
MTKYSLHIIPLSNICFQGDFISTIDMTGLNDKYQNLIVAMYIAVICIGIRDTMLGRNTTTSSNNENGGTTSVPITESEI